MTKDKSNKKKVLIVDDEEAIIEAMGIILTRAGYETRLVIDACETVREAESFDPDVILIDLLMSGEDGAEITKRLRANDKTKSKRIIIFSAHPSGQRQAKEAGADDFIAKPFEIDDLLAKIAAN